MATKNARQLLNELTSKLRATTKLDYQQNEGKPRTVTCIITLTVPNSPDYQATATEPNKKAATEAASAQALAYLQALPGVEAILNAAKPAPVSLSTTLIDIFKACHREAPLNAHYLEARDGWDCWIPLSLALQHTKAVRKWFNAHQQELLAHDNAAGLDPADHSHQVLLLAQQLKREVEQAQNAPGPEPPAPQPAPAGEPGDAPAARPPLPPLTVSSDQLALRLSGAHPPERYKTRHEFQGALLAPDAPAHMVKAVVIKAMSATDTEPAVVEVPLTTQAHFLGQVVQALSGDAPQTASTMEVDSAAGGEPAANAPDTPLYKQLARRLIFWDATGFKWPCFGSSSHEDQGSTGSGQPPAAPAANPALPRSAPGSGSVDSVSSDDISSQMTVPLMEAPRMYSLLAAELLNRSLVAPGGQQVEALPREGQLNVLASWLAGQAIYGDVLITACRPRNRPEGGSPVIRWADFTLPELLLAMGSVTPQLRLAQPRLACMVSTLPTNYISMNGWQGIMPKSLLDSYFERQLRWRHKGLSAPVCSRDVWRQGQSAELDNNRAGGDVPGGDSGMDTEGGVDEEAGEGDSRSVGTVVLRVPFNALAPGDVTSASDFMAEVEVSSNHASRWDAAEQNAVLSVLNQLHAADCRDLWRLLTGGVDPSALPTCSGGGGGGGGDGGGGGGAVVAATGATKGLPCMSSLQYLAAVKQLQATAQTGSDSYTIIAPGDKALRSFLLGAVARVSYRLQLEEGAAGLEGIIISGTPRSDTGKRPRAVTTDGADVGAPGTDGAADVHMCNVGAGEELPLKYQSLSGGAPGQPVKAGSVPASAGGATELQCTLESQPNGKFYFQVRCNTVLPVMEECVLQLGCGGQGVCRVAVPVLGPDPWNLLPKLPASLNVSLVRISQPSLSSKSTPISLFSPPLGSSRHRIVQDVAVETHCNRLLDLGCGDAALINAILKSESGASMIKELMGIDISCRALSHAASKLSRIMAPVTTTDPTTLLSVAPDGQSLAGMTPTWHLADAQHGTEVKLYLASVLHNGLQEPSAWGDMYGVDMATMIEVIEHLQPEVLAQVGPCVLGGLQPRVLLISTPNWEYNKVMREAERRLREQMGEEDPQCNLWPGPPDRQNQPMRCSDHRFEWTRSEFSDWCTKNAQQHGYSVEVTGVGKVMNEDQCESAAGEPVGYATQVAIFRKLDAMNAE